MILFEFFGMLQCCLIYFHQKIARCVMKLSNSGLDKPLKLSEFCISKEMEYLHKDIKR